MNRIPVIAFKAKGGVGKTTAAKYLTTKGYVRTSFASPIRAMLKALGLSDMDMQGAAKEAPSAKLSGASPRAAMQLLGTEWGRTLHPNFWVNIWRDLASDILDQDGLGVTVDDCRFENEAVAVRALGGYVIEIQRPLSDDESWVGIAGHASEAMDFDPDIIVVNDGRDLAAFHASIDDALAVLMQDAADEKLAA